MFDTSEDTSKGKNKAYTKEENLGLQYYHHWDYDAKLGFYKPKG